MLSVMCLKFLSFVETWESWQVVILRWDQRLSAENSSEFNS